MAGDPPVSKTPPIELDAKERVSRYLLTTRHYAATKGLVKTGAFDPSPYEELSVGHTTDLAEESVWQLGETVRQQAGMERLYARADISVAPIKEKKLKAVRDDDPYERHTNVIGWPTLADDDARKRAWKGLAAYLAERASLHFPPA